MTEQPNYISLADNSDSTPPEPTKETKMSEAQDTASEGQEQVSEGQEQAAEATEEKPEGGSWMSKPGNFGNNAGDKIQSGLSPLGKPLGKGLEQVGKPIGSVVDPLVGGIMRTGESFGSQAGVGFGNKEGGPKAQEDAEGKKMKEDIGGKEQTGDNPLGL